MPWTGVGREAGISIAAPYFWNLSLREYHCSGGVSTGYNSTCSNFPRWENSSSPGSGALSPKQTICNISSNEHLSHLEHLEPDDNIHPGVLAEGGQLLLQEVE